MRESIQGGAKSAIGHKFIADYILVNMTFSHLIRC